MCSSIVVFLFQNLQYVGWFFLITGQRYKRLPNYQIIFKNIFFCGLGWIQTISRLLRREVLCSVKLQAQITTRRNRTFTSKDRCLKPACLPISPLWHFAERTGFEPVVLFTVLLVSSEVLLATQPSLQIIEVLERFKLSCEVLQTTG